MDSWFYGEIAYKPETYLELLIDVSLPLLLSTDSISETSLASSARLIRVLISLQAGVRPENASNVILRITKRLCP